MLSENPFFLSGLPELALLVAMGLFAYRAWLSLRGEPSPCVAPVLVRETRPLPEGQRTVYKPAVLNTHEELTVAPGPSVPLKQVDGARSAPMTLNYAYYGVIRKKKGVHHVD